MTNEEMTAYIREGATVAEGSGHVNIAHILRIIADRLDAGAVEAPAAEPETSYFYFVGYAHRTGHGGLTITRSAPVNNAEQYDSLATFVKEHLGFELAITSVSRLN